MNVESVLLMLQSNNLIRTSRIIGNYYQIYCPFHSNGAERKPSCGVLLTDEYKNGRMYPQGFFHCFACGYAKSLTEAVSDILQQHSISMSGVDWLTEHVPGFQASSVTDELIPSDMFGSVSAKYAVNYINSITMKSNIKYVSEDELAKYRYTVPYMYQRGLTDELIAKFDIGFDKDFIPPGRKKPVPCITFPVHDSIGRTLYIVRRAIEVKSFYVPQEVTKSLFGIDMIPNDCKRLLVVESVFNALTAWKYGQPAVALFGTGNDYQINQLKHLGVSELILGLDPDEAGRRGTNRLRKALSSVSIIWSYEGIPEGKDINDLTELEFKQLELV